MSEYKRLNHVIYRCTYHIVWTPKYRFRVLEGLVKELLTKDDTWINKDDLFKDFEKIPNSISDEELRFKINNYFQKCIPKNPKNKKRPTKKDRIGAAVLTVQEFPQLIDYYIKYKEDNGSAAENLSSAKVALSQQIFIDNAKTFIDKLEKDGFYAVAGRSYEEAKNKIKF